MKKKPNSYHILSILIYVDDFLGDCKKPGFLIGRILAFNLSAVLRILAIVDVDEFLEPHFLKIKKNICIQ
jgi:hypothetical protein